MTMNHLPPVLRRWRLFAAVMGITAIAGGGVLLAASSDSATALSFHTVASTRVLDTRPDSQVGPRSTPLGLADSIDLQLVGLPDDATAVSINVTVVDGTEGSFLTVYPTGDTRPTTSTVNWTSAGAVANNATVNIHVAHSLSFYNLKGSVNVIVDLLGYYAPSPSSGSQGVKGDTGLKGDTGTSLKGDKGDTGDTGAAGSSVYAYATNAETETVLSGDPVTFDVRNASAGIVFVAGGSEFTVPATGLYKVTFGVVSDLGSQFDIQVDGNTPSDLPVFGSFDSETNVGTAVVAANIGQVITLANLTSGTVLNPMADVELSGPRGGSNLNEANAWILIEKMNG